MEKRGLIQLVIVLLGLCYVFTLGKAIPLSRSLKLDVYHEDSSSTLQDWLMKPQIGEESNEEKGDEVVLEEKEEEEEELFVHGRMIAENNDYPGAGANKNHDPKPPARS